MHAWRPGDMHLLLQVAVYNCTLVFLGVGHPAAHHAGHHLPPSAGGLCAAAAPEDAAQKSASGQTPMRPGRR